MTKGLKQLNPDAKIIILGTFPGKDSLDKKEYYSSNTNKFWQLLGIDSPDYKTKEKSLKKLNIGIWDVIDSCDREESSSDKDIKNVKYNKLSVLKGKIILFNGKKAYKYFLKAEKEQELDFDVSEKNVLPSSSAAYSITFEGKKEKWNKIINKHK